MKALFQFFRTTVIGGFVVILPIALIALLLVEAVTALGGLMEGIGSLLPVFLRDRVPPEVAAAIVIVFACFAAGLFVRTRVGDSLTRWLEDKILGRIPGYSLIKSVSQRVAGYKETEHLTPVTIDDGSGARSLAFLIEDGASSSTVFVPLAPTPTIGAIRIVPSDRLVKIEASMTEMLDVFGQFGVGTQKVVDPARRQS